MKTKQLRNVGVGVMALLLAMAAQAPAMINIPGVTGPNFSLTAKDGRISTPEGGSIYMWGYANGTGAMQYPGPNLIVQQGTTVTVTLTNQLTVPVSIVFPGQDNVAAQGISGATGQGLLTWEAGPGGTVQYTFTALRAGTFHYHSGTQPDLQIEMGLLGALIVRPTDSTGQEIMGQAYGDPGTQYDREVLFLGTEMDPTIHQQVEKGNLAQVDNTTWWPVYWFFNGRCGPDTMEDNFVDWLPNQPYNCMPMMHPGEKLLMRCIGGGRDHHPFHFHGNNSWVIAKDGVVQASSPTSGPDVGPSLFTLALVPGETTDMIFTWTGEGLGWDVYGHKPGDPMEPYEYAPDHGKPMPVQLPDVQDMFYGKMYSGSPFLGQAGALPPGDGGLNPWNGLVYMWHSHAEREITNNNVYPGGMMTMMIIVPWSVNLDGM